MKFAFALVGAAGRMGRSIVALSHDFQEKGKALALCGALEGQQSPDLGKDAGRLAGLADMGIPLVADAREALQGAQVVIDFSSPSSSLTAVRFCRQMGLPYVVGTTGFTEKQREQLLSAAADIPILAASNMSMGINVLLHLVQLSAGLLGTAFDPEIMEVHHRHKKDAPSGTALSLRDMLQSSPPYQGHSEVYGRQGLVGARPGDEIGIHALRGGDTPGEHTVFFLGEGERLELTHRALSRNAFARGALRAALFLVQRAKQPKLYSIRDVLGLT